MNRLKVSEKSKVRFARLLSECGAVLQSGKVEAHARLSLDPAVKVFFDLDRLWHNQDCLGELLEILQEVARQLDRKAHFDTIISLVSSVGAFGPTPWAGWLALELKKPLIVLNEIEFGELNFYPLTVSSQELFSGKRVLLLKDVIVNASSVQRAARLIVQRGGEVTALLVLVDRKPAQRRYDFSDMAEAWFASLLESNYGTDEDL